MVVISIREIIIILLFIVLFIVPPVKALFSKKASGWSKFIWSLLSAWFSWLGYLAYYHLLIKQQNESTS